MTLALFVKIAIIVFLLSNVSFFVFAWFFGAFKRLIVEEKEAGGETIVFEEITGEYMQSGSVMDKIYHSLLNEDKIKTFKGFGRYFDNPKKVEKEKLRSEAGCILERKDLAKLPELKKKYSVKKLPREKFIITEFPYRNKASVFFGLLKVYPVLSKYAVAKGYKEDTAVTEVYDVPKGKIVYRKNLVK